MDAVKTPVLDHAPAPKLIEPDSPAKSEAGDINAKLATLTDAIRAAATPAVLERHLYAAWFALKHMPDHRLVIGKTQILVTVATDVLWNFVQANAQNLDPARDRIVRIADLVHGVTLGNMPDLLGSEATKDAYDALDAIEDHLLRIQVDAVGYLIDNFAWYAMHASSSPRISKDGLYEKGLKLLEDKVSESLKDYAKATANVLLAGLELGTFALKAIGAVVGAIVGKFVDKAFEWFTHAERHDEEEARRDEATKVATYLHASIRPLLKTLTPPPACTALRHQLRAIDTKDAAQELTAAMRQEAQQLSHVKPPSGNEFGMQLLETWVLENAGEDDHAAKQSHCSELQWDAAAELLAKEKGENAEGLANAPDLFLHQTRGQFQRMGLAKDGDTGTVMRWLEHSVVRTGQTPAENAEATFDNVDDRTRWFDVRIDDVDAFQRVIGEEERQLSPEGVEAAKANGLAGTIKIDLGVNNDTVYVDSWDLDLKVAGHDDNPPIPLFLDAAESWISGETETFESPYGVRDPNRLAINLTPD